MKKGLFHILSMHSFFGFFMTATALSVCHLAYGSSGHQEVNELLKQLTAAKSYQERDSIIDGGCNGLFGLKDRYVLNDQLRHMFQLMKGLEAEMMAHELTDEDEFPYFYHDSVVAASGRPDEDGFFSVCLYTLLHRIMHVQEEHYRAEPQWREDFLLIARQEGVSREFYREFCFLYEMGMFNGELSRFKTEGSLNEFKRLIERISYFSPTDRRFNYLISRRMYASYQSWANAIHVAKTSKSPEMRDYAPVVEQRFLDFLDGYLDDNQVYCLIAGHLSRLIDDKDHYTSNLKAGLREVLLVKTELQKTRVDDLMARYAANRDSLTDDFPTGTSGIRLILERLASIRGNSVNVYGKEPLARYLTEKYFELLHVAREKGHMDDIKMMEGQIVWFVSNLCIQHQDMDHLFRDMAQTSNGDQTRLLEKAFARASSQKGSVISGQDLIWSME